MSKAVAIFQRQLKIFERQLSPFVRCPCLWLEEVGDREPRPQGGAIGAVKGKEPSVEAARQAVGDAPSDVIAIPRAAKPVAFDGEEGDFIQRIDGPESWIELQTVDDAHRRSQPDMFRSQVAMAIDKAAMVDAGADQIRSFTQEAALDAVEPEHPPDRQARPWIKQDVPVFSKSQMPTGHEAVGEIATLLARR